MTSHSSSDSIDPQSRSRAVQAAQGQLPFDLLITGGTLIDVFTGELRPADIGIVGPMIASVHAPGTRHDATVMHHVSGKFLSPGLIDTHVHFESSHLLPANYSAQVVAQGTTTIFCDPHELANVLGLDGVRFAIESSRGLPLRFLCAAPSSVPSAEGLETGGAEFGGTELQEMLSWPEIAGVAEVMDMRGVLSQSSRMSAVLAAGLQSGKLIEGHARGLSGPQLQAYLSAGIGSDHELTSGQDALEKLRAGFAIEIRGSHDDVLPHIVETLSKLPHLSSQISICTDDIPPDILFERGGIRDVLRRLVAYGMSATDAVRCATFHGAVRLRRPDLGAICAGRIADIAIFNDLREFSVSAVFASGKKVAENESLLVEIPKSTRISLPQATVKLSELSEDDFRVRVPKETHAAKVRAIHGVRFTDLREIEVQVKNGFAELPADASLLYVQHRHGRHSVGGQLLVQLGVGHVRGAIATTYSHDAHNLVVIGGNPRDMQLAANSLIRSGGGFSVAQNGALLAQVDLPIAGMLSDLSPAALAEKFRAVRDAAGQVTDWNPPHWTFKSVQGTCLACNPGPHLTDLGLTDGDAQKILSIFG
jgi:adenine deaminase